MTRISVLFMSHVHIAYSSRGKFCCSNAPLRVSRKRAQRGQNSYSGPLANFSISILFTMLMRCWLLLKSQPRIEMHLLGGGRGIFEDLKYSDIVARFRIRCRDSANLQSDCNFAQPWEVKLF